MMCQKKSNFLLPQGGIMKDNLKLCYIKNGKAFFTTQELDKQWGDDWDDAPYEHNAGEPYTGKDWEILKVYFEGDFYEPCEKWSNSPYSVEEINKGIVPWLSPVHKNNSPIYGGTTSPIFAGATLKEFIQIIWKTDGEVYMNIVDSFRNDIMEILGIKNKGT